MMLLRSGACGTPASAAPRVEPLSAGGVPSKFIEASMFCGGLPAPPLELLLHPIVPTTMPREMTTVA